MVSSLGQCVHQTCFFGVLFAEHRAVGFQNRRGYSGTPPYDHTVNTATLLLRPEQKVSQSFSYSKEPL